MTQDIDHWAEYVDVLSGIMKSVSADESRGEDALEPGGPDGGGTEQQA
ncbi:hypothetical protein [Streptomyces sp. NPDC050564]